jgi:hypothetical protein
MHQRSDCLMVPTTELDLLQGCGQLFDGMRAHFAVTERHAVDADAGRNAEDIVRIRFLVEILDTWAGRRESNLELWRLIRLDTFYIKTTANLHEVEMYRADIGLEFEGMAHLGA